jgi:hypothetical protein
MLSSTGGHQDSLVTIPPPAIWRAPKPLLEWPTFVVAQAHLQHRGILPHGHVGGSQNKLDKTTYALYSFCQRVLPARPEPEILASREHR